MKLCIKKIFQCLVIFLFSFNCSSPMTQTVKNDRNEELIKNGISLKVTGFNKPLKIRLKLLAKMPQQKDYPKFESTDISVEGVSKSGIINLDIPPGKYYGAIIIDNNEFTPPLYSDISKMDIYFGFYPEESGNPLIKTTKLTEFNDKKCREEERKILSPVTRLHCPALVIDSKHSLKLELNIEEESSFSESGTTAVWLMSAYVSLISFSPLGLTVPLFTGPIVFERKIDHNLKGK